MSEKNWAGIYTYRAESIVHATSIEQVQEVVAGATRVRALGTRHSFNDIADTDGVLVTVTSIEPDLQIDTVARTATVGAGTRYGIVAAALQREGWALHNMGSLPHISVGGAISTGTHGSGDRNGNLATAVRALEFVRADGRREWVRQGHPDFPGSVVALGALGVLVRVTVAIEPTYLVRQDVYRDLAWDDLLADPRAVTEAGYSVSVLTDWMGDRITYTWVKRRVGSVDEPVPDTLLGAPRDPDGTRIASAEPSLTTFGTAGPWSERLPHFRLDSTPSNGEEIQTEYFVDLDDAADALRAVRALGAEFLPHSFGTELRTVAADDLWLSPAFGRTSLGIHFTWKDHPAAVAAFLPRIEAILAPFGARPHWGKWHSMTAAEIAPLYPRFDDMRDLIARCDPENTFGTDHLSRVLG